jgi:hypothetical protein
VGETLILKHADVDALAQTVAELVSNRVEALLGNRERRLVDRPTMARLANIGVCTLDRLVSAKRIPSVLVGRRRLFDPDPVIAAIIALEEISDV